MDASFWHRRWTNGEIGFHEGAPNALLVDHFDRLQLAPGGRIFVPLCGKAVDLLWLASRGLRVVGAELSELAVTQFFGEAGFTPQITAQGKLTHYTAGPIEVLLGDVFEVSPGVLCPVDAVYDRAALIALPHATRERYAAHLMALTDSAPQLLICTEYDQSLKDGPPFSVEGAEVARLYGGRYSIEKLARIPTTIGRLKDINDAAEVGWLLHT